MRTQIPGKQILDAGVDTPDLNDGAVTDAKLSTTGVGAGAYTKVSVNTKGRVTSGENPTTLAGYGITDAVSKTSSNSIITAAFEADRPAARVLTGTANEIVVQDNGAGSTFDLGLADNVIIPGSTALTVPRGTTAERPVDGDATIRYNEETQSLETVVDGAWYSLVGSGDKRLASLNTIRVKMHPGPGEFSSIKTAVDSISDAAITNRYVVHVESGTYYEDPIQMKRYVSVVGENAVSNQIIANNPNADLIIGINDSAIEHFTLDGATGTDSSAIRFDNASENESFRSFTANDIRFAGNYRDVTVTSSGNSTTIYVFNGQFGGSHPYTEGVHVTSTNGGQARILLRASTTRGAVDPLPGKFAYASGIGSEIFINGCQLRTSISTPSAIGVHGRDGAMVRIIGSTLRGFSKGIWIENAGVAPKLYGYNVGMESNTQDLVIDHPGTIGAFTGIVEKSKVVASAPGVSLMFLDPVDAGVSVVGKFNLGYTIPTLTNVTDLVTQTPALGLLSGGNLTAGSGLTVNYEAGIGYLQKDGNIARIEWAAGSIAIPANTAQYIYVNKFGAINISASEPAEITQIVLGRVAANATVVTTIGMLFVNMVNHGNLVEQYLRTAVGPVYVSGSILTENATTPRAVDFTAGKWFYGTILRQPSAKTASPIVYGYRVSGVTTLGTASVVPNSMYDNGTDLTAVTAGYFTRHALYLSSEGSYQTLLMAYAQEQFATLELAKLANDPTPRIPADASPKIATVIMQQGVNSIVAIIDQRPLIFRQGAGGSNGVSKHGDLTGLANDDHMQYLLASGTRALTGDLSLGGNDITNVATINGLDIGAHASRHQPNGSDPLIAGEASTLSLSTTNTEGISNLIARADHTHALTGVQASSAVLTAIAALSGTGVTVKTGASTWATRTLTAPGRIAITNGDGVAGNPTFDLVNLGTAGTYQTVTTDAYGRVLSGTNAVPFSVITGLPTTLAGYGITDAQPLDSDLTALASIGTTGLYIVTGNGTSVTRSLVAPSSGFSITNPDGIAGPITFALTNDLAAIEALSTLGIPTRIGSDTWAIRSLVAPAAGLAITNAAGTAGNFTFALANDLAGIEGLSTFGIATRTAADTWVTRSLASTTLALTAADGVAGNPTINLSTVGTAGTYKSVTTDAYGRVTAGTNPTTLAGYGITDAQALDSDLTALANTTTTGIYAVTGTGTSATRTITAGSTKIAVTNGSGVAGNPTIDVTEANISLNNLSGTLSVAKGGTALAALGTANQILGVNAGATALEYKTLTAGTGISIGQGVGTTTIINNGILTIGATQPASGIQIVGGGSAQSPTFSFNLVNDLGALEALSGTGFAVRTAADTWAQRSIAVGTGLSVSNGDGVAGNPTISLSGANTAASGLLSSWTLVSGVRYYADFAHNLGTNNVVITLYDTASNAVVTADNMVLTDTNTVRVTVVNNTRTLRIVVVANGLAINTATLSSGSITTAQDSVNVSTAASRLNFTGQMVKVSDAGSGTTNVSIGSRFTFYATALDTPNNSDWAINAFAPTVPDPSFISLTTRQFSNSVEQGVGFMISIPGGATQATFRFRGRPAAAVAGTNVVAYRMYARWVGGTITAGAAGWQAVKELGEISIPASSTQVIYSGFTILLATLNLVVGGLYQIELTRRVSGTTGTNLAANYLLYEVSAELA